VNLGQVLAMQISAPGYPYPLGGKAGSASAGAGTGTAQPVCPANETCLLPAPGPVQTLVSVTVTWAID
jgi:hypothetical protein